MASTKVLQLCYSANLTTARTACNITALAFFFMVIFALRASDIQPNGCVILKS